MTKRLKWLSLSVSLLAWPVIWLAAADVGPKSAVSERVKQLTRATRWHPVATTRINFNTYHPQGLVKIGDTLFASSVEVRTPTQRFAQPRGGYDRDPGEGAGHLFKFDLKGNLIADLRLGEGAVYHPGGIDYDGRFIWVPVAEYRPNSRSIVYRVHPETMRATEVFRYSDHIGAIVHNTDDRTLHGVSWGSRYFYRWTLDKWGRITNSETPPAKLRKLNRSHYIDYQDCKYLGRREMLCGGLNIYQPGKEAVAFALGGLEIVDLSANQAINQVPVELWTESGLPMTRNPFWIEPTGGGLHAYFMPEDNQSRLYLYWAEINEGGTR